VHYTSLLAVVRSTEHRKDSAGAETGQNHGRMVIPTTWWSKEDGIRAKGTKVLNRLNTTSVCVVK